MNLTVFAGPNPLANLSELFRRVPLARGPFCAVVPDSRSVTTFERRLCQVFGSGFLGHRVFTMSGLAMEIISYSGSSLQIISEHVKRALIGEIIKSRIKENSPLHTISHYPGFINLVITFLRDIRSQSYEKLSQNPELTSIVTAYESHLKRLNLIDYEGAVIHALEGDRIERYAAMFRGPLIIDGFYDLSDLQFHLIERLVRYFPRGAITITYDPARPSLFSLPAQLLSRYQSIGTKIIEINQDVSTTPLNVLNGFLGGTYPEHGNPNEIQIHTFRSESSEAGWVAGTIHELIKTNACCPEDIMVVSRVPKDYGSALEHTLRYQGIPVEGGFARPLVNHPVVRLVLNAFEASLHPDREDKVESVQRSCYTRNDPLLENIWQERDEDRTWNYMISEIDSPLGFIESIKTMITWLRISDNLDGGGDSNHALSEKVVFKKLNEAFDEFVRMYSPFRKMLENNEFQHLFTQFLSNITLVENPSSLRGIALVDCSHARYLMRDVVFFLGLDESSFPKAYETYSLHNPEQARKYFIHAQLEEPLLFYLSAYGAKRLYLSFSGIDNEGKDHRMSPYLKEIRDGIAQWCPQQFHPHVPGAGWEKGASRGHGQLEQLIREVKKNFNDAPGILSFLHTQNKEYWNIVSSAIEICISENSNRIVDLSLNQSFHDFQREWNFGRVFSVTDLETYQQCPFNFFLKAVLGLSVEKKITDELDPRLRGQLVHTIIAQFYEEMEKLTQEKAFTREELPKCKTIMKKVIERVFEEMNVAGYGLPTVIFLAEKKMIQSWMDAFLDHEVQYFEETRFRPNALEVAFGLGGLMSQYPALPIKYKDKVIHVGGRIDRIDVDNDGDTRLARVIDYKTGKPEVHGIESFYKGIALQLPLYLSAVVTSILSGTSIHDAVYFNLRNMNMKEFKDIPIGGWEDLIHIAQTYAGFSANGICRGFFPESRESCSDQCEFIALCRGRKVAPKEEVDAAE